MTATLMPSLTVASLIASILRIALRFHGKDLPRFTESSTRDPLRCRSLGRIYWTMDSDHRNDHLVRSLDLLHVLSPTYPFFVDE
jgi:hypothetical protein